MRRLKRFLTFFVVAFFLTAWFLYGQAVKQVPVLMYHFVDTEARAAGNPLIISENTLTKQIHFLKTWGYHIYSLDDFYDIKTGSKALEGKGVVITFDDGNRDFYERVYPFLAREQIPAANFLIWNNLSKSEQGSMSVTQARELLDSPLVTFGAHTIHHLELEGLSTDQLIEEIMDGKHFLEKALRQPVFYFSYPSGQFDDEAVQIVKRAGFKMAFTTSRKHLKGRRENLFTLVRIKVTDKDANLARFWYKVSGFQSLFEKVRYRCVDWVSRPVDFFNSFRSHG